MKRLLVRIALVIVGLCVVALAVLGYIGAGRLLAPPRRAIQNYHKETLADPRRYGLAIQAYQGPQDTPCLLVEPVADPGEAKKGRKLRELLLEKGIRPAPWGKIRGTIIMLHGHTGRKEDNLAIAERFCAAGFRCLLLDLPGHGDNQARLATFGKKECLLVEELAADLKPRFGIDPAPLGLFGISQGGAIALQTAVRPGEKWFAVISVATFTSLDQPVIHSAHSICAPLASITGGVCELGIWCRGGFFPQEISPLNAARKLEIPAYIAHGALDTFIPWEQGKAIYDAIPGPRKTFRIVPDGNHSNVLAKGGADLYADMCEFYLRSLP